MWYDQKCGRKVPQKRLFFDYSSDLFAAGGHFIRKFTEAYLKVIIFTPESFSDYFQVDFYFLTFHFENRPKL